MKIVERFHLTAPDTMSIETTIVDPEALTTPYSMGTIFDSASQLDHRGVYLRREQSQFRG